MHPDRNIEAEHRTPPSALSMLDLRVQVAPDGAPCRADNEALGARPFAEGVVQHLAIRTEAGTRPIGVAEVARLGWSVEEAWSDAATLTRTLEPPTELNIVDTGHADLIHLYSAHDFGASFVPFLDDVLGERLGEHGAVVSIPMRRSVLVHPIWGGEVVDAVQAMIPITRQIHRQGPDSVSAHLYWWQAGHLTWIPTYYGRDAVEFYPSLEFGELIDAIDDVI